MCYGCYNLGGVSSHSRRLRGRDITYYFEMDMCCLYPDNIALDQRLFLELGRETYVG
jgi:hypothetical protein